MDFRESVLRLLPEGINGTVDEFLHRFTGFSSAYDSRLSGFDSGNCCEYRPGFDFPWPSGTP
ncbi:hypothetical protein F2Q70_00030630 [Brassica cretica]|uniref:Uncharacterized protein n=1 Tax=Brassica cretica TaxID=69181 RepID=A0A8S9FIG7_BRACR|nr:hypothetical protein F2Q70_00030630 [Brassica cretica]